MPQTIPAPPLSGFDLGPLYLNIYSLMILAGVCLAVWVGGRRFTTRTAGGTMDDVITVAFWAVPFGIIGARLYHVFTDLLGGDSLYLRDPVAIIRFWDGGFRGLSIWGGIGFGVVGAYLAARRLGLRLPVLADAIAPGLLLAQAVGRMGNWFNQELYGAPTTLPWGLSVDPGHLVIDPATGARFAEGTLFHPTFLYEALWNLAMAALLIWLDRRLRLGHGRVMFLYVMSYTLGRLWIEMLRVDPSSMVNLGFTQVRVNVITSVVLFLIGLAGFLLVGRRHPGREADARRVVPDDEGQASAAGEDAPETGV
ncbi:MAG: prolipoprotein diacylglyceryl transferase [Promicromonosporaceae bacterium]|nr:prolipoprotein diacylglyceryl transferase [Promicromonosporaceae bacterium]